MASNKSLNVLVMETWPYVYPAASFPDGHNQNEQNITIDGWSGIGIDLLDYITKKIGIDHVNVRLPPDRKWGELQDNGTWNGLCGVVLRGEADVGLAYIDYSHERAPHFNSLRLPFLNTKTVWINRKNLERPARHMWTLVRLLDVETWLVSLLCLISAICVLRLVRYVLNMQQLPVFELRIFGSVLGQLDYSPTSVAEQFLYASLLISTMLFLLVFSTSLIAEFTVDKVQLPFESTKQMYEKGYRLGVVNEALSDSRLFRDSNNSWERALYKSRPRRDEFNLTDSFFHGAFQNYSLDNHVMKTNAKYGLLLGQTALSNAATGCDHPWVPAVVEAFTNAFALMIFARNGSTELYHQFYHNYRHWIMRGLIRAAIDRAEQTNRTAATIARCSNARFVSKIWRNVSKKQSMAIETFQSPLILLATGCSLGSIVFGLELLYGVKHERKKILRILNEAPAVVVP